MKFGLLYLPAFDAATHGSDSGLYQQIMEEVEYCDSVGFDSAWMAEHHFHPYGGNIPSPPVFLAAIAQRTKNIKLGTSAICLPLHRPVEVAEQLAMLDCLSNGRAVAGFATAFLPFEFEGFNIDMSEARERYRENIEVVLGLWTQEKFSYDGKFSKLKDVTLWPKPVQKPHPRIVVSAVMTRDSFEYAGQNGFDLMVVPYIAPLDTLVEKIGWYHDALRGAGHDPKDHTVLAHFHMYCHEDKERAHEDPKEPFAKFVHTFISATTGQSWGEGYKGYNNLSSGLQSLLDYKEMYPERLLFGTPEKLIKNIEKARDVGITLVGLMPNIPGLSHDKVMRSLRIFNEKVVPAFRKESAVA